MSELLPCPFCGGDCDPKGWMDRHGTTGPECEECGATAHNLEAWNRRAQPSAEPVAMRHLACIEDGELRMMSGYKIPSHDCELYAMPDGKIAPPLYAHPPAAEIEDLRRDAEYLLWVSKNWGGQRHDYANHVLRVGGTGDLGDIRAFISAAIAQQEAP